MAHAHPHNGRPQSDRGLIAAIGLNLLLTLVEALAGVLSGSLALIADAVHNFNDCASLVIALIARRVSRKPSDEWRTFGYRRAETVGALVNVTILTLVTLYLLVEAIIRFFAPRPIDGWTVVVVAGIALVIDVATAMLLFAMSRGNLNMRAAFLHNLSDALSSVGVIIAGAAVLIYEAAWLDAAVTLLIAGYVLWQCVPIMRRTAHILLQGVPPEIELHALIADLNSIEGVLSVHHVHVWEMDEHERSLEAHIVVAPERLAHWVEIKGAVKSRLRERYAIHHSTLEFESPEEASCEACPPSAGQTSRDAD
jgi:cobalt-zinc-cadmium efflux system protein